MQRVAWFVLCLGVGALVTSACGGDDEGGGSGGASQDGGGATGGSGGTATGGSGGTATGGSGGTATGGSAGTATGGAAGSAGTSGAAGAGGGTGGAAGAGGGSGGATGGTGGATGGTGGATGGTGGTGGSNLYDCTPASGAAGNLKLTSIATGYSSPLLAKSPEGDTARLFVAQRSGHVYLIKNGTKVNTAFLNISGRVSAGGERGLLGVAFHPNFATNAKFYVHYSGNGQTAPTGDTVISEFVAGTAASPNASSDTADPASEKVLLTVNQPYSNHNGGSIEFKPGGGSNLYIALGDGGSGGDPQNNGQTVTTMLGKILRIDVDGTSGTKKYGIPAGNMTGGGALPELWSYGLRNPWRTTFDACTGDMYIADVGQNNIEEVNVEASNASSGLNYGWRVMEGTACFNPSTNCNKSGKVLPVAEYTHSAGCSITGGYVYRGSKIPWLKGTYIYADYCSGRFWSFKWTGGASVTATEITSDINPNANLKNISSFGQDATGELYVTAFNGQVYRIDPE